MATLDVAGQDESTTEPLAKLTSPSHDYTVATVFELIPSEPDDPGPIYHAVDVFVDRGGRHFQDVHGQAQIWCHREVGAWRRPHHGTQQV